MKRRKSSEETGGISLPETSTTELRGKQSVRATFKLTEKSISALSIVAIHLGIKQKSLFDHLMDDTGSLGLIAREIRSYKMNRGECIQKTYVLSRKTLNSLDKTSRDFDAPRDALVECSIRRLLPIIVREREKHFKRKEILRELEIHLDNGERILEKSRDLLGDEDPVCAGLESAVALFKHTYQNIELFVEKGEVIENFDL